MGGGTSQLVVKEVALIRACEGKGTRKGVQNSKILWMS